MHLPPGIEGAMGDSKGTTGKVDVNLHAMIKMLGFEGMDPRGVTNQSEAWESKADSSTGGRIAKSVTPSSTTSLVDQALSEALGFDINDEHADPSQSLLESWETRASGYDEQDKVRIVYARRKSLAEKKDNHISDLEKIEQHR
jgi:hypothetical protein